MTDERNSVGPGIIQGVSPLVVVRPVRATLKPVTLGDDRFLVRVDADVEQFPPLPVRETRTVTVVVTLTGPDDLYTWLHDTLGGTWAPLPPDGDLGGRELTVTGVGGLPLTEESWADRVSTHASIWSWRVLDDPVKTTEFVARVNGYRCAVRTWGAYELMSEADWFAVDSVTPVYQVYGRAPTGGHDSVGRLMAQCEAHASVLPAGGLSTVWEEPTPQELARLQATVAWRTTTQGGDVETIVNGHLVVAWCQAWDSGWKVFTGDRDTPVLHTSTWTTGPALYATEEWQNAETGGLLAALSAHTPVEGTPYSWIPRSVQTPVPGVVTEYGSVMVVPSGFLVSDHRVSGGPARLVPLDVDHLAEFETVRAAVFGPLRTDYEPTPGDLTPGVDPPTPGVHATGISL